MRADRTGVFVLFDEEQPYAVLRTSALRRNLGDGTKQPLCSTLASKPSAAGGTLGYSEGTLGAHKGIPRSVVLLPDHLELTIAGHDRRAAEARYVLCCCGVLVHCGRDFGLHTHEIHAQRGLLRTHVLGGLRVRRARLRRTVD